jgi:hypothetical protein
MWKGIHVKSSRGHEVLMRSIEGGGLKRRPIIEKGQLRK